MFSEICTQRLCNPVLICQPVMMSIIEFVKNTVILHRENSTQTHSNYIFTLCLRWKILGTLHMLRFSHSSVTARSVKSVNMGTTKKKFLHSKTAQTKAKWFKGNRDEGQ